MELTEKNFNPVGIKNYLFDLELVKDMNWEYKTLTKQKEENNKEYIQNYLIITLIDDNKLTVYRSYLNGKIYVNDVEVCDWEDFQNKFNI